jgi:hypothetical protein
VIDIFPALHTCIAYSREQPDSIAVLDQDKWIQKYREQDYAYLTDLYMQFFPGFTYSYNPPATDCPPVLRVQATSLDLLDKPGWVRGNPALIDDSGEE